jgi:GTP 3',8-cyclase
MPESGMRLLDHDDILSYEEIVRVVRVSAGMGITKVRLTGGEPLVRRNVCHLIREILGIPGIKDVGLTTNGVVLKHMARPLWEAGLKRINVSLDTLNPLKFRKITRTEYFKNVQEGIAEAEAVGFHPLKINVVAMRGVNDDEIGAFARLSREKPYAVRFIEYMPMNRDVQWGRAQFLSQHEIRSRLETHGTLHRIDRSPSAGPSRRFRFASARGEIGFIGALSHSFCGSCNRLRLTSNGRLRPCLLQEREIDVKTPLRNRCPDDRIRSLIVEAIAAKPPRHRVDLHHEQRCMQYMSRIGG